MIVETQYAGRDNIIDLLLKADDVAQDLSSVTKIDLIAGGVTVSNETGDSFPIKWLDTGATGKIQLQLGDESIPAGRHMAKIIVYDATYTDGLVWGTFTLVMHS